MKIEYKFVTGTVEVEVSDEWGTLLIDLDRQEYNNDHKETRRHISLDACQYKGATFATEDFGFDAVLDRDEAKKLVAAALPRLTEAQRNLIHALYFEGVPPKVYAKQRGISDAAVSKMKNAALKKMKKVLQTG